jgi:hypothetical protein
MRSLALGMVVLAALAAACREGSNELEDRAAIAALINDWTFHRDQGAWDELRDIFHPDGTISLSWYDGSYAGFVEASSAVAKRSPTRTKHMTGAPRIQLRGDRALAETNIVIMLRAPTPAGEIDTTSYARLYDQVERREGRWRILRRTLIYERDRADPVDTPALPDAFLAGLDAHAPELRFLARGLEQAGLSVQKSAVLDQSRELAALYAGGRAWLEAGAPR